MNCNFRVVSEWDTTTMFMSALTSDPEFFRLFLEKSNDLESEKFSPIITGNIPG